MTSTTTVNSIWDQLAWVILHSIWQGLLVVLLYLLGRLVLAGAARRHVLGVCCLLVFLALQVLTIGYCHQWRTGQNIELPLTLTVAANSTPSPTRALDNQGMRELITLPQESWLLSAATRLSPGVFWLGSFWFAGVMLYFVRYLAASYLLRRELQSCEPLESQFVTLFTWLVEKLKLKRPVAFVQTEASSVPATCGWLRPVVLLPAKSKLTLADRFLDAIVLHELAHIVRRDSLTHHLRQLLSLFYFFNPLVHWLDRQMTDESEKAADELAARAFGDRKLYASALLQLEQTRMNALMLGASGGSLRHRLLNVLASRQQSARISKLSIALMLLCGILALMTCGELFARGASSDQRLLTALAQRNLSENVLDALEIITTSDHASAVMIAAVAEQETAGRVADDTLIRLAQAMRSGTPPNLIMFQWQGRVREVRERAGQLDGYGTAATRTALAQQMTDLARRTADPQLQSAYARAAYALLALDLTANNAASARTWFLMPENVPLLHVSPQVERQIDFAISLHNHRIGQAAQILNGLADLEESKALEGVEAAAYEVCIQISFMQSATQRDWAQLNALLRMISPDARHRWQLMYPQELAPLN